LINYFAIALTHGLLALAAWRLLSRPDLDDDAAQGRPARQKPWLKARTAASAGDETASGDA